MKNLAEMLDCFWNLGTEKFVAIGRTAAVAVVDQIVVVAAVAEETLKTGSKIFLYQHQING